MRTIALWLKNNRLSVLMLAVFLVSAAYSFHFQIKPGVDALAYDRIAFNISQGNGYRETLDTPLSEDFSIVRVGPGYEMFLALIYLLFGHNYQAVWLIQALLLAGSAGLVYLLSREALKDLWSEPIGLISAALIGFSPDLITISGMLMAETLAIFMITLSVWLFFKYYNSPKPSWLIVFSATLSIAGAAMVRSPSVLLFLPWGFLLLSQKRYRQLLVSVTLILVVFSPWIIRNYAVFHQFIPSNLAYGADLAVGNHYGATGELDPYPKVAQYEEEYGLALANKKLVSETIVFIISHPIEFLRITANRVSIYFSFSRPTGFWPHLSGFNRIATLALSSVYSVLIFVLGFWGVYFSQFLSEIDRKRLRYLLSFLALMPLAIIGIIVETRYRFVAYPLFAVFAAYAAVIFCPKRKQWRPLLAVFGILIINTGFDLAKIWPRIIEKF